MYLLKLPNVEVTGAARGELSKKAPRLFGVRLTAGLGIACSFERFTMRASLPTKVADLHEVRKSALLAMHLECKGEALRWRWLHLGVRKIRLLDTNLIVKDTQQLLVRTRRTEEVEVVRVSCAAQLSSLHCVTSVIRPSTIELFWHRTSRKNVIAYCDAQR